MLPYWFLFSLCSMFALNDGQLVRNQSPVRAFLLVAGVLTALIVGLRYDVGGDWETYLLRFERVYYMSLGEALQETDPGYYFVNWFVHLIGFDVWAVNLICGAIFTAGLIAFCRTLPLPWIGMAVAIPYLVIVVAMGYTRQAVAIGFVLLGLASFKDKSLVRLVILTFLAVTFHKTALVVLPLVALARVQNRFTTGVTLFGLMILLYYLFLQEDIDTLVTNYIDAEYESQGALIRVVMNAVPAVIYLLNMKRFDMPDDDRKLWRNFAWAALACLPGLYFLSSSTVIDRLALYLIPLQLVVFAWLPRALGKNGETNGQVTVLVLAYAATIQFVWLNYANHAKLWVPYQFWPLASPGLPTYTT